MKLLIVGALMIMFSSNLLAQSKHIEQSTPFENVLISMKSDSVRLFMSCFTKSIVGDENDEKIWAKRLNEGKEKFKTQFGQFNLTDFTYTFDKIESKLIIYYKDEEQFKMRVVKENAIWKLDEK